jgi:hypothetical protein
MTGSWPRRTPDGRLVPFVAAWLRGKREAQRLEHDHDLVLDQDPNRLAELGWSLARDDVPTPEDRQHLDQLLDQAKARNRQVRQDLAHTLPWGRTTTEPGPSPAQLPRPRSEHPDDDQQQHQGQGGSRARSGTETPVRNETIDPITEYLRTHDDPPDEDWS